MDDQVRDATEALIERKPALRDDIETLLERDGDGVWAFDEVAVDSGAFGEIVGSGLVEETDDGYRLSDRAAIRAAIEPPSGDDSDDAPASVSVQSSLESVSFPNRRRTLALGAALLALALVRILLMAPAVFRPTGIVLAGNDPYMYHHIVEQLTTSGPAAFSPSALGQLDIDFLQFEVRTHDTLLIVVLWWVAALLGGESAVGTVVAWYPVLAALGCAICVYLLTVRLTDDIRCGLAAVLLLAITPAHAYRTALGFGDHHAFDYLVLGVTALAVAVVATERVSRTDDRLGVSPTGWLAVGVGGAGIAAQTAAWRGGPLLVLPIALYVVARTYVDVRDDVDPFATNALLLALTGVGAVLSLVPHLAFDWFQPARAFAPLLLFVGAVGVVGFAALVGRFDVPAWTTLAGEAAGVLAALVVLPAVFPPIADAATEAISYFQTYGGSGIAETQSLFSGNLGATIAPIFLFGFVLFLALPYMAWAAWVQGGQRGRPDWLAVSAYAWWFFLLAIVQNRFSGELSLFTAVFAGIGFLHVAVWVDMARPLNLGTGETDPRSRADGGTTSLPGLDAVDGRTVAQFAVLFLLIGSLGGVQTVVKTQQISVTDAAYETGIAVDAYADEHDMGYPENYVISRWGNNRADNYLVNGETESYEYAQNNYGGFIGSSDASGWYDQFAGDDVGFVVVRAETPAPEESVHSQLLADYGSATESSPALEHYRAIYEHESGQLVAFAVVPGATVTGTAEAGTTITAETTVMLPPTGEEVTYTQQADVGEDGRYTFTTPYPGTYSVGGNEVTVPESAVLDGGNVTENG
ncbi:STT3 domain-containing protein [Haloarcula halophila]|uniref:STT3 domain-containing protein n=1 Tax=Haloarcula TaxID=2237 RepID=UPI0023E4450E|nr:STT3 domain-containing protein [Halomicroarcula sp. DFY41]